MHIRRLPHGFTLTLLIVLTPSLTGCATIGGTLIGSMVSRDLGEQPAHVLHDIPKGRRLDLSLRDGRKLHVWWVATDSPDESAYHAAWRRAAERREAAAMPQPLDTVTWVTDDTWSHASILAFELDALVVGDALHGRARVPYDRIDRLTWGRSAGLNSLALHRLAESGGLPLPGRIRVERPTRRGQSIMSSWADTTLDLADIRVVRMHARGDATRVGTQVGIVMDICTLIALVFLVQDNTSEIL